MGRYGVAAGVAASVLVAGACTSEASSRTGPDPVPSGTTATPTHTPTPTAASATPTPTSDPVTTPFSTRRAVRTVEFLAGEIGPRLATGPAFRRAARWVGERFTRLGYDVARESFPVPAGSSWGVPVDGGRSANVVATLPDFDPADQYVVIGAHLDTIAVAPGAEDNASGVAVVLETARRWAETPGETQLVLVAFGGEEPRGSGEDEHHFGSRHYVDAMSTAERRNLRGMVSLDRVGVGPPLTVAWVDGTGAAVRDALLRSAAELGIDTAVEANTGSDHESFADAGLPAARLGGTSYAAYHSAQDVPAVVNPDQLRRSGRLLWEWLTHPGR